MLSTRRPAEAGAQPKRLDAALAELAAAIREEFGAKAAADPELPERLLSIKEAADALRIGRSTLYDQLDAGTIRSVRVGPRRRLFPVSAIAEYLSTRTVE